MPQRLIALLLHRRWPVWVLLVSAVLVTPALGLGLFADDWFQRSVVSGHWPGKWGNPLLDLFVFMTGDADANGKLFDFGAIPWWGDRAIKASFLRPVSAATHMLDQALWPDAAWLQHAHGIAWWLLGLGLVIALYRRVGGAAPTLAALMFAVDDAHAMTIGWNANRNALVALAFGAAAVLAHLPGDGGDRASAVRRAVAVVLFTLALGAGESGLGALGYLVAWEAFVARDTWGRRVAALAPYLVVVVAWRLVYHWMGYGAEGTALYVDPGRTPLAFLWAIFERLPVLAAGQWLNGPADAWFFLPRTPQLAMSGVAALAFGALVVALLPTLRADARARFWLAGATLSLVPLCAAFPTDRLLLWPGLGAFGLVAALAGRAGLLGGTGRDHRRLAIVLLVFHLPLAALALPLRFATLPMLGGLFDSGAREAPNDAALAEQTLVFANGFDLSIAYTMLIRQETAVAVTPRRVLLLGSLTTEQRYRRVDERTLEAAPEGGFFENRLDGLFYDPSRVFVPGETIHHPVMDVEIVQSLADGRPAVVRFHFHEELEDHSLRWVAWVDGRLVEWSPPRVGEQTLLPPNLPITGLHPVDAHGRGLLPDG